MEIHTREGSADRERVNQRLRDLAQAALNDDDYLFDMNDTGRISPRRISPLRGADRFDSPERGLSRYVCLTEMPYFYSSITIKRTNMIWGE